MGLRAASRTSRRGFSTSAIARSGHAPEGPYSNLPFKVHGRKFVPYWVLHFGFFSKYNQHPGRLPLLTSCLAFGLGLPFAITYYQLKKQGSL